MLKKSEDISAEVFLHVFHFREKDVHPLPELSDGKSFFIVSFKLSETALNTAKCIAPFFAAKQMTIIK